MQINRCISCENEIETYPCPHCGFDPRGYEQPGYALPVNHILHGRYLIGKVLGQGGFGITYIGWDLVLDYKCAIKEYYPNGQAIRDLSLGLTLRWSAGAAAEQLRRTGMESFLKEARKMNRVDHVPEVVRVRDTFIENETAYIVMEYVEGETLKDKLSRDGVLSWEQARAIFIPAMAAMEKVHQAGLVHRDLSPDNIMLEPTGTVKILDLGAAKDLNVNTGLSSMQVIKGGFSPIEQYSHAGGSGTWTDVYAMAATIYYSLTGKLPPAAVDRLAKDGLSWDLPQIQALPKTVRLALQKAMVVLAENRTQTMGELLKAFQAAPVKKQQAPKKETIKKEKREKMERRPIPKSLRIIAAVLALAITAGLILYALPTPKEEGRGTLEASTPRETAETEHIHDFAPATVGSPARCSCGLMTGTALNSTFSAAYKNVIGLREDGSVTALSGEYTNYWLLEAEKWQDVVSVQASYNRFWGITRDGQVLGTSVWGEEDLPWNDIVKVDSDHSHAVGLHRDGTVVTQLLDPGFTKEHGTDWLDLEDWTDMVDIAVGSCCTVGLKADGTLEIKGTWDVFPEAKNWQDIVSVSMYGSILLGLRADGRVEATGIDGDYASVIEQVKTWRDIVQIDCAGVGVVGLKSDGTVELAVREGDQQVDVSDWQDIVAVCFEGGVHGLRRDGTVVTASIWYGQDTSGWTGIKTPKTTSAPKQPDGNEHVHTFAPATVGSPARCSCGLMTGTALPQTISAFQAVAGVRADGSVMAQGGLLLEDQVSDWRGVSSVVCGLGITYGIKEDGSVLVAGGKIPVGDKQEESRNNRNLAQNWTDIVSIADGSWHTVGLRKDGTAVAVGCDFGSDGDRYLHLEDWHDLVAVAAGLAVYYPEGKTSGKLGSNCPYSIGLKSDGTLVFAGEEELFKEARQWRDIVSIATDSGHLLGLKADGTVVACWNDRLENAGLQLDRDARARIESWTNMAQLSMCSGVMGLTKDGRVKSENTLFDTSSWTNVSAVAAGYDCGIALKNDGTAYGGLGMVGIDTHGREKKPDAWSGLKVPGGSSAAPSAQHVHSWAEATISAPKHCTLCGEMEGRPLHNTIAVGGDAVLGIQENQSVRTNNREGTFLTAVISGWPVVAVTSGSGGIDAGLLGNGTFSLGHASTSYYYDAQKIWTDLMDLAAGDSVLYGLQEDGTVLGVGAEIHDQRTVTENVVSFSTSETHLACLKEDGTVFVSGSCASVEELKNVVGVAAGDGFTLGLKYDGTVLAAWEDHDAKAQVESWTDIVAIAAGGSHAIGLKSDGTLVWADRSPQNNWAELNSWRDIVSIATYDTMTMGLKSDGSVVTLSHDDTVSYGSFAKWTDIKIPGE